MRRNPVPNGALAPHLLQQMPAVSRCSPLGWTLRVLSGVLALEWALGLCAARVPAPPESPVPQGWRRAQEAEFTELTLGGSDSGVCGKP